MPDRPGHFHRHRFPAEVISYAVWLYYRFPLSHRDVEELLSERGIEVSYETVRCWAIKFGSLFAEELRLREVRRGKSWHLDEVFLRMNGRRVYLWRAIDEHGQVIDVYVSPHRAAEDAKAFFRRSITSTGVRPRRVTTDKAACYPPALAEVLPEAEHVTGKQEQQRLERDHQHLKGRLRPMRNLKTEPTAQVVCEGHGFVRNLAGGFCRIRERSDPPAGRLRN